MIHPNRILVPIDFSEPSKAALRHGIALTRAVSAHLVLIHVPEHLGASDEAEYPIGLFETMHGTVHDRLGSLLTEREIRELAPERVMRLGRPAEAIVSYAAEQDIDLIVMGTHGRQGVTRMLVGSVTEAVVRRAPCPVLTVHSIRAEPVEVDAAGAHERRAALMFAPRQVLVPTDFGDASVTALRYARAFAQAFGSSLHLLHVRDNAFMRAMVADPRDLGSARLHNLHQLLTDHDRCVLQARAVVEVSDNPAEAILEYARSAAIDFIVMGTHGRTGMDRALTGSVAEQVIRSAPCPVLTVRQPERELVLSRVERTYHALP
jgi:nucleotide-binding universal stress UspA family protein